MRLAILLVFVAVPLLEIALLIKLGEIIHFWPTFAIVIGTAIVGTSIMHRQGLKALMKAQSSMAEGTLPIEPVIDGAFLLVAGAFLLTPGLLTDSIGFLFLVPPFRRWLARWGYRRFTGQGAAGKKRKTGGPQGPETGQADTPPNRTNRDFDSGPVIEGDFQRLNDKPPKK